MGRTIGSTCLGVYLGTAGDKLPAPPLPPPAPAPAPPPAPLRLGLGKGLGLGGIAGLPLSLTSLGGFISALVAYNSNS